MDGNLEAAEDSPHSRAELTCKYAYLRSSVAERCGARCMWCTKLMCCNTPPCLKHPSCRSVDISWTTADNCSNARPQSLGFEP